MKNTKTGSLLRLVAFLLITVVLIGAVGLVSEGMSKEPSTDDGSTEDNNTPVQDEPTDDSAVVLPPEPVLPPVPEHLSYLTGLEVSEEIYDTIPSAFVLDSSMPLYGISDSPLTVEFPIEDGTSRLLMYTENVKGIGKIGSIHSTRRYISILSSFFGGILVHNSSDDTVDYTVNYLPSNTLDLDKSSSFSYSEGSSHLYTNGQLMSSALDNSRIPTRFSSFPTLPYSFISYYADPILGDKEASSVQIPLSSSNLVGLKYDAASKSYVYQKNGINRVDLHNGEYIYYTNAFVLFCDATTYEREDTTELVLDTQGGGTGYYFTMGTMMKILWTVDSSGNMIFTDSRGEKLCINRGNTYISYFKTTQKATVQYSG